jgi:hypothetical protein
VDPTPMAVNFSLLLVLALGWMVRHNRGLFISFRQ